MTNAADYTFERLRSGAPRGTNCFFCVKRIGTFGGTMIHNNGNHTIDVCRACNPETAAGWAAIRAPRKAG
jgi:hypothetical protein